MKVNGTSFLPMPQEPSKSLVEAVEALVTLSRAPKSAPVTPKESAPADFTAAQKPLSDDFTFVLGKEDALARAAALTSAKVVNVPPAEDTKIYACLFDTGSPLHVLGDRRAFASVKLESAGPICFGPANTRVAGQGQASVQTNGCRLTLTRTLYVPSLSYNVISAKALAADFQLRFEYHDATTPSIEFYFKDGPSKGKLAFTAEPSDSGHWYMNKPMNPSSRAKLTTASTQGNGFAIAPKRTPGVPQTPDNLQLMHRRYGRVNLNHLQLYARLVSTSGTTKGV